MFRIKEISFFLLLSCIIILLFPRCMARNTMDSLSQNSSPLSVPSQASSSSDSDPLSPSAIVLSGSIAEILKQAIIPKLDLNLAPSPEPNPNPNSALNLICNTTDCPELCVSRLSPLLSSGGGDGVNPMSMLEASIKACIERLHDAVSNLSSPPDKTTSSEAGASHASALADCKDNKKEALDNLQNALDALKANDVGTVSGLLSAVVLDISTCDDAFKDMNAPPVADFTELISNMARNCLVDPPLLVSMVHTPYQTYELGT